MINNENKAPKPFAVEVNSIEGVRVEDRFETEAERETAMSAYEKHDAKGDGDYRFEPSKIAA